MSKKQKYDGRAHERRVRNAGALALNSLKGPARERVVLYWLSLHWEMIVTDIMNRPKHARSRR